LADTTPFLVIFNFLVDGGNCGEILPYEDGGVHNDGDGVELDGNRTLRTELTGLSNDAIDAMSAVSEGIMFEKTNLLLDMQTGYPLAVVNGCPNKNTDQGRCGLFVQRMQKLSLGAQKYKISSTGLLLSRYW
jgi:hypothetical protein